MPSLFMPVKRCRALYKSFVHLFKGGRVQRQRLWSRPAGREIPPKAALKIILSLAQSQTARGFQAHLPPMRQTAPGSSRRPLIRVRNADQELTAFPRGNKEIETAVCQRQKRFRPRRRWIMSKVSCNAVEVFSSGKIFAARPGGFRAPRGATRDAVSGLCGLCKGRRNF